MLFKQLFFIPLLSISFSVLNADIFELRSYNIFKEQKIQANQKNKDLNIGLALDIKTNNSSGFNYTLAYEGDYMFMNNYLEDERKIKNNNYYIGIGYKF